MVDLIFQIVKQRLTTDKEHCEIEQVRIGSSKESLDNLGDNTLTTYDVISLFGHYIKYYVKCCLVAESQPVVNAFEILMLAQSARNTVNLPQPLVIKNKLDQLTNDLRSLFESKGFVWKADEVHGGTASKTLQVLRDVLWYIDGSHSTLHERSCHIQRFLTILKAIINHKITNIVNDKSIHCQEMSF